MLKAIPAAVAIAVCLSAGPLRAQVDQLPDPCKVAGFTADEQQQITTYVNNRLGRMSQGVPEVEKARGELNQPLQRACVSVAFRQLYRAAALDGLTRLAADANPDIATNALYVLSQIADDPARQVLQSYTADSRGDVRYAAIVSMKYVFDAVERTAPALDAARASDMVKHLGDRLAEEADPVYIDAIARALLEAAAITREGYGVPATQALTTLADGLGARLRAAAPEDRPVLLVTALLVGEALSARLAGGSAGNSPEIARAGAAFGGEMLAHLAFLANKGDLPQARRLEVDLATLSERILVFAASKLGASMQAPGLPAVLEGENDKQFYAQARELVLSLGGRPYELAGERMDRIGKALEGK